MTELAPRFFEVISPAIKRKTRRRAVRIPHKSDPEKDRHYIASRRVRQVLNRREIGRAIKHGGLVEIDEKKAIKVGLITADGDHVITEKVVKPKAAKPKKPKKPKAAKPKKPKAAKPKKPKVEKTATALATEGTETTEKR